MSAIAPLLEQYRTSLLARHFQFGFISDMKLVWLRLICSAQWSAIAPYAIGANPPAPMTPV
jgi:hypothetical protein